MTVHFIVTQGIDCVFELHIHVLRCLRFYLRGGTQRIVNAFQRTINELSERGIGLKSLGSILSQHGTRTCGLCLGLDKSSANGHEFLRLISVQASDILHVLDKRQLIELRGSTLGVVTTGRHRVRQKMGW